MNPDPAEPNPPPSAPPLAAVNVAASVAAQLVAEPAQAAQAAPRFRPRPWLALETPQDVELWIAEHNQSLVEHIGPQETGYGVCFTLAEGGNVYMHTSGDAVILDVDADAQWIAPLIIAATGAEPPPGHIWVLPEDKLIQLVVGFSPLVASTTLFSGHNFAGRSRKPGYSR